MKDTTSKIAELNDLARTAMGIACRLVQTAGINALPLADQSAIREKVETFDAFTPDNDPYGERDFGAIDHAGHRILGSRHRTGRIARFAARTGNIVMRRPAGAAAYGVV